MGWTNYTDWLCPEKDVQLGLQGSFGEESINYC